MGLWQQPDGTYVSAAEHFGYKAEHTMHNQVLPIDIDALIFDRESFETDYDEECAEHMRDWVRAEMCELDYENGNWYWLPIEESDYDEALERVFEKAFSDPDAPKGIKKWWENL